MKSRGTRSFNTGKVVQTKYCGDGVYPENIKDKRKYMKQEAKRIKSELKSEEMKDKQEKKELKDLDIHLDGKKKRGSSKKGNRRMLTNKTLEMLCRKFDHLHASENNLEFRGPKLNLGEIGLLLGHWQEHYSQAVL